MKKQNSAKGFKIIYFIISALWMAWWGGFVLFAIAGPMEGKIIAFFAALLPIPIYYIIKGFFIGSKKIMNQPKYILIIVVLGIIAFVGWNKIGTSVKDKELVVECGFSEDKEEYILVNMLNGKMCFIQPDFPTLCEEIEIFDSEVVKTKSLNRNTSAMVQHYFEETSLQKEFYWKLNRKTGILGIYWSNNNQYIGPGSFVNCRKKEKL